MSKTLGPVALKLGNEVLVKIRTDTTIKDLLEQLDKACNGGRIQDADGFDVTAHYSQDLPEGEYAIKQPTAVGPIAAAVRVVVSSMHANLLTWQTYHNIIAEYNMRVQKFNPLGSYFCDHTHCCRGVTGSFTCATRLCISGRDPQGLDANAASTDSAAELPS